MKNYNLENADADKYKLLEDKIQEYILNIKCLETVWIIKTNKTSTQIHKHLYAFVMILLNLLMRYQL